MLRKKQRKTAKNQATKTKSIRKETNNSLCKWLFTRPLLFSLLSYAVVALVVFLYSIFAAIFNTYATEPLMFLVALSFCWVIYYTIKRLPHEEIHRDDFIAIVNGCSVLTILVPFVALLVFSSMGYDLRMPQYRFAWLYEYHPVPLFTLLWLYLFVFGVTISNIYAKYKRAVQIGISKWMVIASMPFAFLLLWAPGYLIEDKSHTSNLKIKSKWYSKFNKWVVSDSMNTMFMFLFVVVISNMFAGSLSLLLTGTLLVIYALWNLRYKTKFIKDVKQNYAWGAVGINIAILIIVVLRILLR